MLTTIHSRFLVNGKLNGPPGSRPFSGAANWLLNNYRMLCLMGCGMAPIAALCLTIFGLWSLRLATLALILPAIVVVAMVARRAPAEGKLALVGFLNGIVAVLSYDAFRLWFVWQGWWGDFIPKIGGWLLGSHHPDVLIGYTWRYVGNGGGMGMTCVLLYALAFRGRRSTLFRSMVFCAGFGVVIWVCLILTLLASDRGQSMLFYITPLTLLLSLIGHLIYGACIGICNAKVQPYVRRNRSSDRLGRASSRRP